MAPSPPPPQVSLRALWPVAMLAVVWGIGPALPALLRGELLGQPWTDLYPSVWGLWWFAQSDELLPTFTSQLAHPDGMGFYYSSPIKGTLARAFVPLIGVAASFNLLTLAARVATVLCAGLAARAWGRGPAGCLAVAAVFGCAPFFHGYAVEGIIEGTDGWPLALWAWAVGRRRWGLSALAIALSVVASWYLGACALLLALLAGLRWRGAWLGLLGMGLAAPFIAAFVGAFPAGAPLDPAVRAAMGAPLTVPRPGVLPGIHPFALTAYLGWICGGLALVSLGRSERWLLWALVPVVLSLGVGPWYALPGLELLRFPYRWHAATLAMIGLAVGILVDRLHSRRPGLAWLLGPLIVTEGLLLSPVEPVLPGAPAERPSLLADLDGPVLDVPGPVAMPPGVPNPSRPRARWLLYFQTAHGQPSPWAPDFNSVGVDASADPALEAIEGFDEVAGGAPAAQLPPGTVSALRARGIGWVVIHRTDPGLIEPESLRDQLVGQGAREAGDDGSRWLIDLEAGAAGPVDGPGPAR